MKEHDVIAAEINTAAPRAWWLYNDWPMHCAYFATSYVAETGIVRWKCNLCDATINNADLPSASDGPEDSDPVGECDTCINYCRCDEQ